MIIESLGNKGQCFTCGSKDVYIYNTESDYILIDLFDELLNTYTPMSILPDEYPREKLNLLKDELHDNWNIFNLEKNIIYRLVTNIYKDKYSENPEVFDTPVGIRELVQENYLLENSVLKTFNWEQFVESIKKENRFHTNYINTEVLQILCSYVKKPYKSGTVFYRARISGRDGFPPSEMGAPPHNLASAGRANPEGISHLYLSSDVLTTLKETRSGAYDYVTVGKFVLNQDIEIVDLTAIDKISAFSGLNCTQHAINKEHLRKINYEIARPLRRHDSPLDYLPTQYITDFIKSIKKNDGTNEYSGIEYRSTMSKDGFNLTVFNEEIFTCESISILDIEELSYRYNEIVQM